MHMCIGYFVSNRQDLRHSYATAFVLLDIILENTLERKLWT